MLDREKLTNKSIPLVEKGNFCRYLATTLRAGTPILEAIDMLSSEAKNKNLKNILLEVKVDLEKGKTLGESFGRFPKAFDTIFLTVIKAGEESGTLDRSLEYLGKQIFADYYLLQRVKGAMLYPLVVVSTMVAIGFLMAGFVLPRIAKVFLTSGLPMPPVTRFIFTTSLFVEQYLLFIAIGLIGVASVLVFFFVKGEGRNLVKNILPHVPYIRDIFSQLDIARFGRILGTLLGSGVPILEALKISASSFTLPKHAKLANLLETQVSKGTAIREVLHTSEVGFPRMVTGMIAIGEETGTLENVLFDIASFYEQEVDNSLKSLTTILEPVLMIIVGIIVTVMVLSVITPIYSLIGSLQAR